MLAQRIVTVAVADKNEGDDGEFYRTMGFIRRSERASGITRGCGKGARGPRWPRRRDAEV